MTSHSAIGRIRVRVPHLLAEHGPLTADELHTKLGSITFSVSKADVRNALIGWDKVRRTVILGKMVGWELVD